MLSGDVVELTGLRVEVLEATAEGRPETVEYTFSKPLEDASLRWIVWDGREGAYVPFDLPDLGETVRVAPAPAIGAIDLF